MTGIIIASNDRRIQYTASAAQTVFPYDFPIFDDDEIAVYRTRAGATTLLTLSTDYTVSGVGTEAGGNVTLTTGATASDVITIAGAMPNARTTDFQEGGDFRAEAINRELDRLQIQAQELRNRLDRTARLEVFDDPQTFNALPVKADRAGKYAAFDANGQLVPTSGTTSTLVATPFAETLLDDANAAAMRTTLGLGTAAVAATGTASGQVPLLTTGGVLPFTETGIPGLIFGLTLSNNGTDATNDIDIAAGVAAQDASPWSLMQLASALTKRLDAAWAVGTAQGGLDTGSIANGTYHIWLIRRSDTGVVDALFSASATAPTMPASYDQKRRIGSIIRASGTIVAFSQNGDEFLRAPTVLDVSANNPGTSAVTRTLSVPTGIKVNALMHAQLTNVGVGVTAFGLISELDRTDEAVGTTAAPLSTNANVANSAGNAASATSRLSIRTNTSAQVRSRLNASDASVTLYIATVGWIDRRGRDA